MCFIDNMLKNVKVEQNKNRIINFTDENCFDEISKNNKNKLNPNNPLYSYKKEKEDEKERKLLELNSLNVNKEDINNNSTIQELLDAKIIGPDTRLGDVFRQVKGFKRDGYEYIVNYNDFTKKGNNHV